MKRQYSNYFRSGIVWRCVRCSSSGDCGDGENFWFPFCVFVIAIPSVFYPYFFPFLLLTLYNHRWFGSVFYLIYVSPNVAPFTASLLVQLCFKLYFMFKLIDFVCLFVLCRARSNIPFISIFADSCSPLIFMDAFKWHFQFWGFKTKWSFLCGCAKRETCNTLPTDHKLKSFKIECDLMSQKFVPLSYVWFPTNSVVRVIHLYFVSYTGCWLDAELFRIYRRCSSD